MEIRLLYGNELQQAVFAAHEVFEAGVRPFIRTQQEADWFYQYVRPEQLWQEMNGRSLFLWGAFENGFLCAVGAIRNSGQITMLYVRPHYVRRRIGLQLVNAMSAYAANVLGRERVTINVTPVSAASYFYHIGFTMIQGSMPGETYIPLERRIWSIPQNSFGWNGTGQPAVMANGYASGGGAAGAGYGIQPGAVHPGLPGNGGMGYLEGDRGVGTGGNAVHPGLPGNGNMGCPAEGDRGVGAGGNASGAGYPAGREPSGGNAVHHPGLPGNGNIAGRPDGDRQAPGYPPVPYGYGFMPPGAPQNQWNEPRYQFYQNPGPVKPEVTYPVKTVPKRRILALIACVFVICFSVMTGVTVYHLSVDGLFTAEDRMSADSTEEDEILKELGNGEEI